MKKVLFALLLAGVMTAPSAFALTANDHALNGYDDDSQTKVVEPTTAIQATASDTSLSGAEPLTVYTCPTDKLCTGYVTYTYSGTTTNVRVALLIDDNTRDQDGQPTTNEANAFAGEVVLNEAETIKLTPVGATVGDDLYGYFNGRTVDMKNTD